METAGVVLVKIAQLTAVGINFARDPALLVQVPCRHVTVGVGQRGKTPTGAPTILRRAAQGIDGLEQLTDRVVAVARYAPLPIDALAHIERSVDRLVAGPVGVSRRHRPVIVVIRHRHDVAFAVGDGVDPARTVVGVSGRCTAHWSSGAFEITAGVIGQRGRFAFSVGAREHLAQRIIAHGRDLARSVGDRQRQVLAVIGHRAEYILARTVGLADLQEVDAVGIIAVVGRPADGIEGLGDHSH
jgi:hypothetical protein